MSDLSNLPDDYPKATRVVPYCEKCGGLTACWCPLGAPSGDRQILLNLIGSLTLADHMGDAMDDAYQALKLVGIVPPEDLDPDDLGDWLARNHGATSIWGTSLLEDPDEH